MTAPSPVPPTPAQVRRRFWLMLPVMFGTGAAAFALLNIVQPMSCNLAAAYVERPGCGPAIIGYILHIVAGALTGILTLPPMRTLMRRVEKHERDRDERLHDS